jgi:hypothetical protein
MVSNVKDAQEPGQNGLSATSPLKVSPLKINTLTLPKMVNAKKPKLNQLSRSQKPT